MLRKLAGQTIVYGISTIISKLLSYLMTPYLTRVLTREEYGVTVDMYALIPFVLVLLTMGLETGYFRFAAEAPDNSAKRKVFASVWGAVILAAVTCAVISFAFLPQLAAIIGYALTPQYVAIVLGIIVLDAVTAVPYARLRQEGRAMKYMMVRLVSVIITIVITVLLLTVLPYMADAFGGVWSTLYNPAFAPGYYLTANFVASAVVLLMLLPTCDGVLPKISVRVLKPIFIYSLPLLLGGIAGTANEFIDRQMIKFLMPEDVAMSALGVYGAVVKVAVILIIFTQIYRIAAEPFFLANFKKEDFKRANAEALKYFIVVSIGLFLMIGLFADIFELIVGSDFREGMAILPVIMISNILAGVVLNLSFWYKQTGATRFALYVTGTGLIFTVLFNILLVPTLGIVGAAVARLICEMVMVTVSYIFNQRYYPIPYDLRRMGEYLLLGVVIYSTLFFTASWPLFIKYTFNFVLLCGFGVYALKREKIDVVAIVKSVIKR